MVQKQLFYLMMINKNITTDGNYLPRDGNLTRSGNILHLKRNKWFKKNYLLMIHKKMLLLMGPILPVNKSLFG